MGAGLGGRLPARGGPREGRLRTGAEVGGKLEKVWGRRMGRELGQKSEEQCSSW